MKIEGKGLLKHRRNEEPMIFLFVSLTPRFFVSPFALHVFEAKRIAQVRVSLWDGRMPTETVEEEPEENPREAQPAGQVEPVEGGVFGMQHGHDDPVQIEPVHDEKPDAHDAHHGEEALRKARQEHDKGHDEVKEQ